jgi:hypothetical protein
MLVPGEAHRFSAPGDSRHLITTEPQWNLERESRPALIIDNHNSGFTWLVSHLRGADLPVRGEARQVKEKKESAPRRRHDARGHLRSGARVDRCGAAYDQHLRLSGASWMMAIPRSVKLVRQIRPDAI